MTISCYCCSCTPAPTNESQAASNETTEATRPPTPPEMDRQEVYELAGTVQALPSAQPPPVVIRPLQTQIIIVAERAHEEAVENVIAFHASMQSKEINRLTFHVDAAGISALAGDIPSDSEAASSRRTSREHSGFGSQKKPVGAVGAFGTPRAAPAPLNPAHLLNLNTLGNNAPASDATINKESL